MAATLDADTRTSLESFVDDWLVSTGAPGAAVAVVDGADLVYVGGFGARDLASNAPATGDTLYGVGSVTKPVTATAVCTLVVRGALGLDDPVSDHLDLLADAPGDPVTVRDLLTHTSGLPADDSATALLPRYLDGGGGVPLSSRADFDRHVRGSLDRRRDDGRFRYYNSGYVLLGRLVEAVDGRDYPTFVRDEVCEPLGMDAATFDGAVFDDPDAETATPYVERETGYEPATFPADEHVGAAGGLLVSAREASRFLRYHASGGDWRPAGRLLADEAADGLPGTDLLATAHERAVDADEYLDGTTDGYRLGWQTQSFLDDRLVSHGGSVAVSTAWLGFLASRGLGVVVACNATPEPHPMHVGRALLALLSDETPEAVVRRYRFRAAVEAVTGRYEGYRGVQTVEVSASGGELSITFGEDLGEQTATLVPESPAARTFRTVGGDGRVLRAEFEVDEGGATLFFDRHRFERVA
jgi:CubicO group peptidase (beta-lactamase class C family)